MQTLQEKHRTRVSSVASPALAQLHEEQHATHQPMPFPQLPVGYFKFHRDPFLNYQLNRWYSLGYTDKAEIAAIGATIKNSTTYVTQFLAAAERAEAQAQFKAAAFYYRAAEFLVEPGAAEKLPLYQKFRTLFYQAFADEGIERHEIPYAGTFLPALRLLPDKGAPRGVIVAFGGFDAFMEEFYPMWAYLAAAGYEVIAFEGPGQGAALRLYDLPFDHDWEKPTGAVLDYFSVDNGTLVGVSMGGYWALRAAAFEKRISRVVAWPPVYDWMAMAGGVNRGLVHGLLKWRKLMNALVRLKMTNERLKHTINQTLFLTQKTEPIEAVEWMLGMNKAHLHSERVAQDVLLLGGEHDAFQPMILLQKQQAALNNAHSITTRVFTKAEHGDQHCQIGNLGLALQTIVEWLDGVAVA